MHGSHARSGCSVRALSLYSGRVQGLFDGEVEKGTLVWPLVRSAIGWRGVKRLIKVAEEAWGRGRRKLSDPSDKIGWRRRSR